MIKFATPVLPDDAVAHVIKIIDHLKTIKKVIRGRKACHKAIKSKKKGILILPFNISPCDLIAHLPMLCEDNEVKYCYVDREVLRRASNVDTLTCCVFVKKNAAYRGDYNVVKGAIIHDYK
ncbi:Box H/ACA snoRNP component, involved in ribosomal RNA pseudouridinylation [Trachipleistophora hominis]|uniref:Box H/ACA snoRNP component, involved in ribosomal RNA pseudouridinylation n=1 Tax=Trachipleistophora hominis TaxID=72359 RepID=L7JUX8_TRAHO|nr:Box H/ACA snoRNP component, involved in ribosomal RNA pseudouridinylation [Trachipleistophora hominis]